MQFVLTDDNVAKRLWDFVKSTNWRGLAKIGRPVVVEVSQKEDPRTLAQNRRYWKILNQISEHGSVNGKRFASAMWHQHFRNEFLRHEDLPFGGTVAASTTTLSFDEFSDYMAKVEVFAVQELGIELDLKG